MGIAINILSYPELLYFNLLSFRGVIFRVQRCICLKSVFIYHEIA